MVVLGSPLADAWFAILGGILLIYLLLDGFALGVGVLSLFRGREAERAVLMRSVAPVWHINQTWLVMLGGVLFGAFPVAYGQALSALYVPLGLLLLGFAVRGVSIEYHEHARRPGPWSLAFGLGSLLAALALALGLGAVLAGLSGGVWGWLSPLALLAALAGLAAFGLLGSCYLLRKVTGALGASFRAPARITAFYLLLLAPVVLTWAVGRYPWLTREWLNWPGCWVTSLPLVAAGVCFALLVRSLARGQDQRPLTWAAAMLALAGMGLAGSLHPHMLPPGLSLYQAAAPEANLRFMLYGLAPVLPVVLWYNLHQYRLFRGPVQ